MTALDTPKAIPRREDKQQRKRLGRSVQKGDSWSILSFKCPHTIDCSFVANHNYISEQKLTSSLQETHLCTMCYWQMLILLVYSLIWIDWSDRCLYLVTSSPAFLRQPLNTSLIAHFPFSTYSLPSPRKASRISISLSATPYTPATKSTRSRQRSLKARSQSHTTGAQFSTLWTILCTNKHRARLTHSSLPQLQLIVDFQPLPQTDSTLPKTSKDWITMVRQTDLVSNERLIIDNLQALSSPQLAKDSTT